MAKKVCAVSKLKGIRKQGVGADRKRSSSATLVLTAKLFYEIKVGAVDGAGQNVRLRR